LDGGIQLHEYAPALLHTKMMIIDGAWATVGSANFDNRSMAMNDELNVMFYDQTLPSGWRTFSRRIFPIPASSPVNTWNTVNGCIERWACC
jgi:phosphatidylserine/phosphatidylglycerophosphate/cardiolipin synthase-like enzyme